MIRIFFLICSLVALSFDTKAQNASFYKEHITFKIEAGYFYVNGQYYLKNYEPSKKQIALFFPFPTDTIYSPVDSLLIYNFNEDRRINDFKKISNGVVFNIDLDTVTIVYISYRQQLKSNTARYILTTTQYWGKPLEEVSYELITPAKIKITSFSYPPDKMESIDRNNIYFWRKENFMPEFDMIFTFE
jgi:hypothetical protein